MYGKWENLAKIKKRIRYKSQRKIGAVPHNTLTSYSFHIHSFVVIQCWSRLVDGVMLCVCVCVWRSSSFCVVVVVVSLISSKAYSLRHSLLLLHPSVLHFPSIMCQSEFHPFVLGSVRVPFWLDFRRILCSGIFFALCWHHFRRFRSLLALITATFATAAAVRCLHHRLEAVRQRFGVEHSGVGGR